ncbi:hypothetical protein PQX77_009303 [Marasmius sp. AFHP31]|nr:hypothetical protein PQX77_009303 [Marasmius sp. AFHP31]
MAIFSKLIPPLATSLTVQAIFASIFVPLQDDRCYDLGGTIGFLTTTFVSVYYPTLRASFEAGKLLPLPSLSNLAPRQLLLTSSLAFWTSRLGLFLFQRALQSGGDSRFDRIKRRPARFTTSWMIQGVWTFLVGMPVYLSNAVPPRLHPALSFRDYLGFGIFAGSFLLEALADYQKSKWKREKNLKKHSERFIKTGVWSISRHPNYLGEIGIWTGLWLLSTRGLQASGSPRAAAAVSAISPLFTYFILNKVSGIPLIENANNKKFANDPEWLRYKQ